MFVVVSIRESIHALFNAKPQGHQVLKPEAAGFVNAQSPSSGGGGTNGYVPDQGLRLLLLHIAMRNI